MRAKCVLIATISLLLGCSNLGNVKPDFSFGPNPDVGLVVLSTVEDNRCEGFPLGRSSTFNYSRISESNKPVGDIIVNNPFVKTDFSNPPGSLRILALEEGEYAFTSWVCQYGNWRITAPIMRPRFRVKTGEIIYLGEIHFLVPPDGKTVRATITDRSGRDLALFSKKMLNFSASDVRNLREESANEQSGITMSVGLDSPEKEQE